MHQPQPALIIPRELTRTDAGGVLTEKALDGQRIAAPELVFGRFVIEPRIDLAPHIHSADSIAYCIRGTCNFRIGEQLDEQLGMGPGDYVYIPAGTLHTESTGSEGVEPLGTPQGPRRPQPRRRRLNRLRDIIAVAILPFLGDRSRPHPSGREGAGRLGA